jgi:hypothetical protein
VIDVSRRARRHADGAGDPLDGLVNLFDVGIVLAVAFLLAALASLNLTDAITRTGLTAPTPNEITVQPGDTVKDVPGNGTQVIGRGTKVGSVYQLKDGRLVYVVPKTGSAPTAQPTPTP